MDDFEELEPSFDIDLLIALVRQKLPGAVSIRHDGTLIWAVAPKGQTRLIGTLAGVSWPRGLGRSFDLKTNRYGPPAPNPPYGWLRGPYMSNVYPSVRDRVDRERRCPPDHYQYQNKLQDDDNV